MNYKRPAIQVKNAGPDTWPSCGASPVPPIIEVLHSKAARGMVATGEEVRQVEELANAFFPDFLPRLCQAGAGLRSRQRTLCLLTKLNFMPSEIAVLTGRSLQAVSNMRSRTCAALFGAGSKTWEFDGLIGKL